MQRLAKAMETKVFIVIVILRVILKQASEVP